MHSHGFPSQLPFAVEELHNSLLSMQQTPHEFPHPPMIGTARIPAHAATAAS